MSSHDLRKDITGLRAVAVLAVTLFHIFHLTNPESNWFKGGFLGVDIFFVISGFLMTMIIVKGIEQGNFSLLAFYKRRAKRICPALVTVVLIFSLITAAIFNEIYAERILKDGIRSLGFISNFRYARLTDYFDLSSAERMFLHTWSLSVEWQFYLLYPILILIIAKLLSRKSLGLILSLLTLISLIFGCIYTTISPTSSYYYLPSRAFEMLAGGLAYFYPLNSISNKLNNNHLAKYAEIIGLLCIAISLMIIGEEDGWPNAWAILPIFGTWLCLAAANNNTVLANPILQYIGLWSYSIYLVHWPIMVLFFVLGINLSIWMLLILIFTTGIALHYGIERRRNYGWIFFILYFTAAGLIYGCIKIITTPDIPQQTTSIQQTNHDKIGKSFGNNGVEDHYGDLSRPVDLILVGDSFARQYLPILSTKAVHSVTFTVDGCYSSALFVNNKSSTEDDWQNKCISRYTNFVKALKQYPNVPVIWAQNWSGYNMYKFTSITDQKTVNLSFDDIVKQDLSNLSKHIKNRKIYILSAPRKVGPEGNVNFGINCSNLHAKNTAFSQTMWNVLDCRARLPLSEQPINVMIQDVIKNLSKTHQENSETSEIHYIDVSKGYCNEQGCLIMTELDFKPIFLDTAHFKGHNIEPIVDFILEEINLPTDNL